MSVPSRQLFALVGVINPATQVVLARPIAQQTYAAHLHDVLRQLWRHVFAGNTGKMAAALIATDWQYLHPGIQPTAHAAMTDGDVIAGVGVAASDSVPQPANVCLTEVGDLGAEWLCLIDPAGDTVTIHTTGGQSRVVYPLAG
ncbi:hypothetical protein [Phytohabitans aurantiacus]|uniref:Uncharacterized protein n=1 Tax=Phytohabitans aurantiacus TaxID=3016789 RepID=A0ABQ5R1P8_9ACTN|nr:hypothetical protein [Phytohabitans aurantiacus]GLI00661.1 hypothetical protein Pa4123_59370 [Phytohabitans aurantiacus]